MSSHQVTPALSELIRMKDAVPDPAEVGGSAVGRSREDWKKEKELEEARKVWNRFQILKHFERKYSLYFEIIF